MTTEKKKEMTIIEGLKEPMEIGQVFMESGMFPDVKTQAQCVVKILAGKELGLTPFESMNALYIVNGKLSLTSNAMSTLLKKTGKYNYKVDILTDQECAITFSEGGEVIGTSTFTFKDAAKAGLVNKDVWKNYPRNMLFARALSNGIRWFCPDVCCGYYTTEEVKDFTDVIPVNTKTITMTSSEVKNGEA
jgi:hypothetical protein